MPDDHGEGSRLARRGLMLAPTPRDGAMAQDILADSGIESAVFDSFDRLTAAVEEGAGALVLMEEFFASDDARSLLEMLVGQPPWSNLPLIVLSSGRAR